MTQQTRSGSLESLLAILQSGTMVSVTAPLEVEGKVLVGFALSTEQSSCLEIPLGHFIAVGEDLYRPRGAPLAVHGLKRIWECLDEPGSHTNTDTYKYIDIHNILDTKLMAYLIEPDSVRPGERNEQLEEEGLTLTHLSRRYLGEEYPYRVPTLYGRADLKILREVLAHDAGVIFRLAAELPSRMAPELKKLYHDLELPIMVVLDGMRRVGIGFDGVRCAERIKETERKMALLAEDITKGQSVDLTSHEQVYDLLVAQGVPVQAGPVSVRRKGLKQPLERIAHAYPLVRKILAWWEMGRDLGFLRTMAGRNRVHAIWGQTRSATSRMYARSPALQNISRDLRNLFVPASGHVLVKADYSQAQLRILAHLSEDPELMRVYNDPNGDVHRETSDWLGLNDRDTAKEINFAICFGMGKEALCKKINSLKERQGSGEIIEPDTAQAYIDGFYERFPKVRSFFEREWEEMKRLPTKERVVRSLLARERRFPGRPSSDMERQFRVTWPQQIEADLIKTAMVRLDRIFKSRNLEARMVMMIHDSLWVEAPKEEEAEVRELMQEVMTQATPLSVPLVVDFQE